jgi:hypothetical protein
MWNGFANAATSNGGNNFVVGGIVLLIITTLSRWIESGLSLIGQYVFRSVFVSVDMDNTQECYVWVAQYLAKLSRYVNAHSYELVSVTFSDRDKQLKAWGSLTCVNDVVSSTSMRYYDRDNTSTNSAKTKAKILFLPGSGLHLLFRGWRCIIIHKTVEASASTVSRESIWMGTFGNSEFFEDFINEARTHSFSEDATNTVIYIQVLSM